MLVVVEAVRVALIGEKSSEQPVIGRRRVAEPELDEPAVERVARPGGWSERRNTGLECAELGRGGRESPFLEGVERRSERSATPRE